MRIVSLSPAMTEILYAIGAGDDVAAVTKFCDWPPLAKNKPKVGSLINTEPEKINELKPDLIVASYFMPRVLKQCSDLPKLLILEPKNLWDVFESIRLIGEAVGRFQEAEKVVREMKDGFDEILSLMTGDSARVYMEEWYDPPTAAGYWVPELVAIAGGEEVIAEVGQPSQAFSLAAMNIADPDIIVCHWWGWGERFDPRRLIDRPGWENLRAVSENKVFFVNEALINRPSPRLVEGAHKLERIFSGAIKDI